MVSSYLAVVAILRLGLTLDKVELLRGERFGVNKCGHS
jgi:hypothetical protein